SIVADYVRQGFPADLVDASKRSEIASALFRRNSISDLAAVWSQAVAAEGRRSPDEDVDAIRRVTVADVNRVAMEFLKDTNSITATLLGNIRHETTLQEPPGKDGVSDVLDELFSYGTDALDRLAFQKALDDIAASESAGYDFSLKVPTADFGRGVELLADNVLHPALPADAFNTVKQQTAEFLEGEIKSPGYQAAHVLKRGLLPPGDPGLREPLPQTV